MLICVENALICTGLVDLYRKHQSVRLEKNDALFMQYFYEVPSPPKLLQIYCYANLFADYCFLHHY